MGMTRKLPSGQKSECSKVVKKIGVEFHSSTRNWSSYRLVVSFLHMPEFDK